MAVSFFTYKEGEGFVKADPTSYAEYPSPLKAMIMRCNPELANETKEFWLNELIAAHINAARKNDNLSKGVFVAASRGNGSFVNSVIAALASIGHLHAPIWEARQVIFRNKEPGDRVPGFGNSFFKKSIDPSFQEIWDELEMLSPDHHKKVEDHCPKGLFPNAAAITAAVCELIGYPDGLESEIFIHARLAVWADCWKQPPTLLA